MINSNEELGLIIETITPSKYTINVDTSSSISIRFNRELNPSSIMGNIVILEDLFLSFTSLSELTDSNKYKPVKGSVAYKNCVVTFKPDLPLNTNSRYIVLVRGNRIKDILGKIMIYDFNSSFCTKLNNALASPKMLAPEFGIVTDRMPTFQWEDLMANMYVFQLSKDLNFEVLICDVNIKSKIALTYAITTVCPEIELNDGLYYARVKAINGEWSESLQFFFKSNIGLFDSLEDIPEGMLITENSQDEYEILEVFPKDLDTMIDLKVNIIYIKFRGVIDVNDINFSESSITATLADTTEADDIPVVRPQDQLVGMWNTVVDSVDNSTYVIFTPNEYGVK